MGESNLKGLAMTEGRSAHDHGHGETPASLGESAIVTDPVCGMKVDTGTAEQEVGEHDD